MINFAQNKTRRMKLLRYEMIFNFCKKHPESRKALNRWAEIVENAEWKSHNDLKGDFLSADYVGNNRYVFNISGNKFRLVAVVVFFDGRAIIRFIGTHSEYDKIKDIKSI